MTPNDLKIYVEAARLLGITHLRIGDTEFWLEPKAPAPRAAGSPLQQGALDPVSCACGHLMAYHSDNGCLHGCRPHLCISKPTQAI